MSVRCLATALCLLALGAVASPAAAQEVDGERTITPSTPDPFAPVTGVDLVSHRDTDGPPVLVLLTEERKLRPADGAYRASDGKALVIEDGRLVEFSDPEAKIRRFRVASIDKVAGRMAGEAPRLVLRDARGRTEVVLSDGRFTSKSGVVLLVREGMIVGYGGDR